MSDRGRLRIESIEFYAGPNLSSNLKLNPGAITVFIGPNNGGKSRALKEIGSELSGEIAPSDTKYIIKSVSVTRLSGSQIESRLVDLSRSTPYSDQIGRRTVKIYKDNSPNEVHIDEVIKRIGDRGTDFEYRFPRRNFLKYFLLELGGESRLGLLKNGGAQDLKSGPQSLAASFFLNDDLCGRLSKICLDCFGFHLVIDPSKMGSLVFSSSLTPLPDGCRRSISDEAIDYFRVCQPVSSHSDGTRAFIGIVAEVIAGSAEVVVIDEPEAFLHPSLARRLAQEISHNISSDKQAFIATHSASFLSGLVSSVVPLGVIRLSRRGGISAARALDARKIKTLMQDPLLRSANLLEALFFESCVVVEGDGDSAFYREINDRLHMYNRDHMKHVSFVASHSKQSAHRFSTPLRELGIPAACILDIDWVKEDGVIGKSYFLGCGVPEELIDSFISQRRSVRRSLESANSDYKRHGGIDLLSDGELEAANDFFDRCEMYGLFTVRKGELESWLSDLVVNRTKNKWIASVFDAMGSNPELAEYVKPGQGDVWDFLGRIAKWVDDPLRKGML